MAIFPFSLSLFALPVAAVVFIIIIQLLWLWSVVTVARQKTPDPFDRIVWLLIVLSLNIVGTILYALFSPRDVIDPNNYSPYARSARQAPRKRSDPQPQTKATAADSVQTQNIKQTENK